MKFSIQYAFQCANILQNCSKVCSRTLYAVPSPELTLISCSCVPVYILWSDLSREFIWQHVLW